MPWDCVPAFLESARIARLFPANHLESLSALDTAGWSYRRLAEWEPLAGILSDYQRDRLSRERPDDVLIGNYPILAELGAIPGGISYRALHPILRNQIRLQCLAADAVGDDAARAAYVQRAQAAGVVSHLHLAELIDAVELPTGEILIALTEFDGADLESLTADIGPMPTPLAIHYAIGAGHALAAAHERGLVHGTVAPARMVVGPLAPMSKLRPDGTPRLRPASTATLKLFGLGLRFGQAPMTVADDVRDLARSLFFLLTARRPESAADIAALKTLRPDVPDAVVELLTATCGHDQAKPPTLPEFLRRLEAISTLPTTTQATAPTAESLAELVDAALEAKSGIYGSRRSAETVLLPSDDSAPVVGEASNVALLLVEADRVPTRPGWTAEDPSPLEFVPHAYAEPLDEHPEALPHDNSGRIPREDDQHARKKIWLWIGLGLGLQVFAVLLWVIYITQPFSSAPVPTPPPKKSR